MTKKYASRGAEGTRPPAAASAPSDAVLDQKRAGDGAARRTQNLEHDGIVDPAVMSRRDRSAEDEHAGAEGDEAGQPDRIPDHADDAVERGERLAHMDRGDIGKASVTARARPSSSVCGR